MPGIGHRHAPSHGHCSVSGGLPRRLIAEGVIGAVPFILVLNKMDLADEWRVDDRALWRLAEDGWSIIRTSAKSGAGVDDAFLKLTTRMVAA